MSPVTGWIGGPVDGETPLLPQASLLAGLREPRAGDALAIALARSQAADARQAAAEAADAPDPDERAANLLARGVAPGQIMELGQRLAEVESQLAEENERIERSERRQARIAREHEAGRLSVHDIMALPDADEGDYHRASQLERRAGRLRVQLAEAQGRLAPQQDRETDPLVQATSRAHEAFVTATRAKMAASSAAISSCDFSPPAGRFIAVPNRTGHPAPRPFSGSRGGVAVRGETVTCGECIKAGATVEQSFLIHHDPELRPVAAGSAGPAACSGCGHVACRCGVAGAYVRPPAG